LLDSSLILVEDCKRERTEQELLRQELTTKYGLDNNTVQLDYPDAGPEIELTMTVDELFDFMA